MFCLRQWFPVKLKPGKQIVLLLTADGQVAGAEDADKG